MMKFHYFCCCMLLSVVLLLSSIVVLTTSAAKAKAESFVVVDAPEDYFGGLDNNNDGYMDWYDEVAFENKYTSSTFLPSSSSDTTNTGGGGSEDTIINGVAIHWKIVIIDNNDDDEYIELAVAARATGWLGFGLAEAGGMEGADMVLYEESKPNTLTDAYNLKERYPLDDDCNHWEFVNVRKTYDGFLIWEGRRKLNTGDQQDRIIIDDSDLSTPPHRVIAAWGDSPTRSYHNTNNRVRGAIRFFDSSSSGTTTGGSNEETMFEELMEDQSDGSFVVLADNYPIKPQETEYVAFCASMQDLLDQGVPDDVPGIQIIGFEPIVDESTKQFVHHFVVSGSLDDNNALEECYSPGTLNEDGGGGDDGNTPTEPIDLSPQTIASLLTTGGSFQESVYGWAPGESSLALPSEVGKPIFGLDDTKSFQLNTHYNNPARISGMFDSSGVKFYYTVTPRRYELGSYSMADLLTLLRGRPVLVDGVQNNNNYYYGAEHTFECPSTCTQQALDEPVTVIREYIHMHKAGARGYTEQIRNGAVIRSGNVDFFEFDQQGNFAVQQQPYTVEPGDTLRTVCQYKIGGGTETSTTTSRNTNTTASNPTIFGLSSQEEMCIGSLLYYPRKKMFNGLIPWMCNYGLPIPGCSPEYTSRQLVSENDMGRIFGSPSDTCDVLVDGGTTSNGEEETSSGDGNNEGNDVDDDEEAQKDEEGDDSGGSSGKATYNLLSCMLIGSTLLGITMVSL